MEHETRKGISIPPAAIVLSYAARSQHSQLATEQEQEVDAEMDYIIKYNAAVQLATEQEQDEVDAEMDYIIKYNSAVNTVWRENETIYIGVDYDIHGDYGSFSLNRRNKNLKATIEHNKTPSLSVLKIDPSQVDQLSLDLMEEFGNGLFHISKRVPSDHDETSTCTNSTMSEDEQEICSGSPTTTYLDKRMGTETLVGGHPIINCTETGGGELGTVGCILKIIRNSIEERLILSNAHVVFGQEFRNLNSPDICNNIYHFLSKKNLGEVSAHGMRDFNPLDPKHKKKDTTECYGYVDYATCTLDHSIAHTAWKTRYDLIDGVAEAQISAEVTKSGCRSKRTLGKFTRNVTLRVDYKGNFLIFKNIMLITPNLDFDEHFSVNGDSGSVVMQDKKIVGLLFADSDNSELETAENTTSNQIPITPTSTTVSASNQIVIDHGAPERVKEKTHASYAFHIHDVLGCMGVKPDDLVFHHDSWVRA